MTQADLARGLAGAALALSTAIESDPRLMSEPMNVMVNTLLDMIDIISDANNGHGFDAMRMLVALGQIGTQTTRAPEFWKIRNE